MLSMLSFFPAGQVQSKVNICSVNCLVGNFEQFSVDMGQNVQHSLDDSDSSVDTNND